MLFSYIITMLLILGLLLGWIGVQQLARRFAHLHPEFGPAREEGGSCLFCLCKNTNDCPKKHLNAKKEPLS